MTSKVSIISNAFILLGRLPINDIDVRNPEQSGVSIVYDRLISKVLSIYPWTFALTYQKLSLLTTPPPMNEWQYAFQLPTIPRPLWIYRTYPKRINFKKYEDKLYTNSNTLAIDYIFKPSESKFPDYFENLMVYQLAGEIAFLITRDFNIASAFKQSGQREMLTAMGLDGQQQTNTVIERDEIYEAHFS